MQAAITVYKLWFQLSWVIACEIHMKPTNVLQLGTKPPENPCYFWCVRDFFSIFTLHYCWIGYVGWGPPLMKSRTASLPSMVEAINGGYIFFCLWKCCHVLVWTKARNVVTCLCERKPCQNWPTNKAIPCNPIKAEMSFSSWMMKGNAISWNNKFAKKNIYIPSHSDHSSTTSSPRLLEPRLNSQTP